MEIAEQIRVCKEHGLKPGDKIRRAGIHCCYVASIGAVCDWAVYEGPSNWWASEIAAIGNKIPGELAAIIFPDIAALGLYYRP
jgi:hypothetical protein